MSDRKRQVSQAAQMSQAMRTYGKGAGWKWRADAIRTQAGTRLLSVPNNTSAPNNRLVGGVGRGGRGTPSFEECNQKCLGACDSRAAPTPPTVQTHKQNLSSEWREMTAEQGGEGGPPSLPNQQPPSPTSTPPLIRHPALCGDHNYWHPCVKI